MKEKSFIRQVFDIGIGTVITVIIGIITTPIITRLVDPTMYGQFALFNTYLTLGLSFLCLGLDQSFLRFFYQLDTDDEKLGLLRKCIILPIIIWLLFLAVAIICSVSGILPMAINQFVIVLYFISLATVIFNRFALNCLRVQNESKWYATLNCLTKVIYVSVAIILVYTVDVEHIYILILANLFAYIVPTIIAMKKGRKYWSLKTSSHVEVKYPEILKYGLPLMVSTSVFSLFQAVDRISLNHYCTISTVGVYAGAQTLMTAFSIIQQSFNIVWGPKSVEKYESGKGDTNDYYCMVYKIMVILMFSFGATILVAKNVFVLLLGEKYREASAIIPFLMLNPIMYTISETTNIGLVMKKKSMYQVYIVIISCVINIIGNTILVPMMGVKGAAISTGISYVIFFFLRTLFSHKFMPIQFGMRKLIIILIMFCLMAFYHTVFTTNIYIAIIIYVGFIVLLIGLYRKDVIQILNQLREILINKIGMRK